MTKDEALKLALAALEESCTYADGMEFWDRKTQAITAIEEALAQTSDSVKQEPVGTFFVQHWRGLENQHFDADGHGLPDGEYKLYTTPPKRQPLTLKQQQEIEIDMTINQGFAGMNIGYLIGLVIKATEAAHDIKETT